MSDTTTPQSNGMGILGWLTIVFIILKLNPGGHLDSPVESWSWWLIVAPIGLGFLIGISGLLILLWLHIGTKKKDNKRLKEARERFNRDIRK